MGRLLWLRGDAGLIDLAVASPDDVEDFACAVALQGSNCIKLGVASGKPDAVQRDERSPI